MITGRLAYVSIAVSIAIVWMSGGCTTLTTNGPTLAQFMDKRPTDDQLAIAKLKEKRGDLEEAQEIYRRILKADPKNTKALHRSAVLLTKQNKLDEAKSLFEKALDLDSYSVSLINDYGYHCFLKNDHVKAEELFIRALDLDPDFVPACTNLGLTLGEQARFDEARLAFQRATVSAAEIHCNMGYVYTHQQSFELARNEFNSALDIEPNHVVAIEGLLQVSRRIPGQEPITVVKTVGVPRKTEETDAVPDTQETSREGGSRMLSPVVPTPTTLHTANHHFDAK
ncbi:MAG: tetratricopeptide repeat protein [Pirellulaceae bacterium]|nr:tetratricopeptide repeat protein [Pirellulaceae bacterium]